MEPITVGIVGFGNVGRELARRLVAGAIPNMLLVGVSSRRLDETRKLAEAVAPDLPVMTLAELVEASAVIAECATAPSMQEIARFVLGHGRKLVCVSAGGLLDTAELEVLALQNGGCLRIANGALPALDILRAVSQGVVKTVHLTSVIRPESLFGEPYAIGKGLDFQANYPEKKILVFEGTTRAAAANFPRHMNIATSLAIAGIGLDRTTIELWVDPEVPGARNTLNIVSDVADVSATIQNIPSKANKKTSAIVVPSILSALRGFVDPIVAGG
jgi:aspartate dehydrogenase